MKPALAIILALFISASAQAKPMHVKAMSQYHNTSVCIVTYEGVTYRLDCSATQVIEPGKDYEVVSLKKMPGFGTYMKVILHGHPDGLLLPVLETETK
jgi:hypothetical protein